MIDTILTQEQKDLRKLAREFTTQEILPKVAGWDREGVYPMSLFRHMGELGMLGLTIPEEYGGTGGGTLELVLLMEETSKGGCMMVPMPHVSVCPNTILAGQNDELKRKWLPAIARGEVLAAFAQTEPEAGSDVGAMLTTATQVGDEWILNGSKHFISYGALADVFIVVAKTTKGVGTKGVSVFLVERDSPGFRVAGNHEKMGWHTSPTTELVFEDCRIPKSHLLVPEGNGFRKLINTFNGERCGNAATCLGIAEGALELTLKYIRERQTFGQVVADYQGVRWMLADMATDIEAARLLIFNAAYRDDRGLRVAKEAAMAKCVANEMAQRVTNTAIQLHGGFGYMREFQVERYFRDVRGLAFGGGTPQILRNRVAEEVLKA